ncbi:MAG TPA: tetratricopeptide repeat protein, partial [Longimicrobium sp.]|nr:tetratricopeptide repeat protein [Longimicrobium sp.]
MEQGRADMAEAELRQALRDDPHDPFPHALLALCLSRLERGPEALGEARQAVGLAPDFAFAHYAHARVLLEMDRADEAERAIRPAIEIDPDDPDFHAVLAAAHLHRRRWADALAAANEGLRSEPDHVHCTNLRATALVQLGRRDEATIALGDALARDPTDAHTHANQGWALLHRGRPREALEHFRESLRLDPTSPWARAGLAEAMKARNPVYAALLRYFLWMSRLDQRTQWMIVIGGVVGYNFLSRLLSTSPGLKPFVVPLIVLYLSWVLLSWTAEQLFNLVLFLDPLGRNALTRDQRLWSAALGTTLLAALVCGGITLATGSDTALTGAILFGGMMIPIAGTSRARGKARRGMAAFTGALALLALGALTVPGEAGGLMFTLCLFGVVASSWIGNFVGSRH